jgi:Nuclease-related domain
MAENRLPPAPSFDSGVAGSSSQRVHDQRADERERRLRSGFPLIGGFIYRVRPEPQNIKSWSSGAAGERAVGGLLESLSKRGVLVLHDRRIPGSSSNIDHIAISSSGLYVIDTKHYQRARVKKTHLSSFFGPDHEQLIVQGQNRTKLVTGTVHQRDAVRRALWDLPQARGVPLLRMLVFVDSDWGRFTSPIEVDGAWIGPPRRMAKAVSRSGPIDSHTVLLIGERLAQRLKPA